MTLGTWPEEVPEQFRIPRSKFQNNQVFQKFSNEGIKRKVGDNRLSGGCVIDDFNKDGYLDIMASSWGFDDELTVYINQGNGKFRDESSQPGLEGICGGLNLVSTDYNNDGNIDILVLRGAWLGKRGCVPNSLLKGKWY
ncbi:MAG: VCBS repeat-containing protein [Saprospiraceae bacterium]